MPDDYTDQSGNGDGDMPAGSYDAPKDMAEKNTVTIPMDMLPPGYMPKDGEKMTFCVEGEPDENGCRGYFEAPKAHEDDWEADFKKSMSARDSGNDQEM